MDNLFLEHNLLKPSSSISNRISPGDRFIDFLCRRWILLFGVFLGTLSLLPFLAPLFLQSGFYPIAGAIYTIYSFLCHQLPERSFFMFGPQVMYSLTTLENQGADLTSLHTLRQFYGTPEMGWKVAWSDRMVWMYASMLIFGLLWWPFRRVIRSLPLWGLGLFLLPMAIDGFSHLFSDFAGIGMGFRSSNQWLAEITSYSFPASFYQGDALGSFNFWMRLLTGFSFGLGVIWFSFPYINQVVEEKRKQLENPSQNYFYPSIYLSGTDKDGEDNR
jgi:uncharacterized membrane protein